MAPWAYKTFKTAVPLNSSGGFLDFHFSLGERNECLAGGCMKLPTHSTLCCAPSTAVQPLEISLLRTAFLECRDTSIWPLPLLSGSVLTCRLFGKEHFGGSTTVRVLHGKQMSNM